MKKMIKVIIFCILTVLLFYYVNRVLLIKRTDGITTMQDFYAQDKNSIDVLILGSSHAGLNISVEELYSSYGISSYALWGSVQPFWNTYYFMKEALKTQSPEVIILECYAAVKTFEYSDDARQITNIEGMKLSLNKIAAIQVSAPKNRWKDLILGMPLYHSRYSELTENDFVHFPWSKGLKNSKGGSVFYGTNNQEVVDVADIKEKKPLDKKEEKYLRKIIEYAKEKGIPLILVKTPTCNRKEEQPYYNSVEQIAQEYGIDFYNFNLLDDETGFESSDYWTDGAHINTEGSRKITNYLGKQLIHQYNLIDHRDEQEYNSWKIYQHNMNNLYLNKITSMEDYFKELFRDDRSIFLIKNSTWEYTDDYLKLLDCMKSIGIKTEEVKEGGGGCWLLTSTKGGAFENKYVRGSMHSEFEFDKRIFSADFENKDGIQIDGKKVYSLSSKGIILIVYDETTHECADVVTFLETDSFELKHAGK